MNDELKTWLLKLARETISAKLQNTEYEPGEIPPLAETQQGCFVSLHTQSGQLRGCMGTFSEDEMLWRAVMRMAICAATQDPRFPPLRSEALSTCQLELSVLSPRYDIAAKDVIVGRHGLWISRGNRSGVLLPQVPVNFGWTQQQFLEHTCKKAGLDSSAWETVEQTGGAQLEAFEAEVFSEHTE